MLKNFLLPNESLPLHIRVKDAIRTAIQSGMFAKDKTLPGMKELEKEFSVSHVTIHRALNPLLKEGLIENSKGKKFLIKTQRALRVLLVFNRLSSFKRIIYNGIIETLGSAYHVDLKFHNYELESLRHILLETRGLYDHYLIMPHFYRETPKEDILSVLRLVPPSQLLLLDKHIPELEGNFASVYQDFESDVYEALASHPDAFDGYRNVVVLNSREKHFPQEIIAGIKKFSKHFKKKFSQIVEFNKSKLKADTVYFALDESDLADILKNAATVELRLGIDIGVVAFNETDLMEVLDITVMSTNWQELGRRAGKLIKEKSSLRLKNDFCFIVRGSLKQQKLNEALFNG